MIIKGWTTQIWRTDTFTVKSVILVPYFYFAKTLKYKIRKCSDDFQKFWKHWVRWKLVAANKTEIIKYSETNFQEVSLRRKKTQILTKDTTKYVLLIVENCMKSVSCHRSKRFENQMELSRNHRHLQESVTMCSSKHMMRGCSCIRECNIFMTSVKVLFKRSRRWERSETPTAVKMHRACESDPFRASVAALTRLLTPFYLLSGSRCALSQLPKVI